MSVESAEDTVKTIVQEHLGVFPEQIAYETSFMDDLGADSLDCAEMLMAMEEAFGFCVPEQDADALTTFGKVMDYLKGKGIVGDGRKQ